MNTMFKPPVTTPGIYDLPAEVYHGARCTPEPALSASFALDMERGSPARAWCRSSLNPNFQPENKSAFDIGKAAHLLFLEPHLFDQQVVIVDADDWRTKAAKEARTDAWATGKVPLLPDQAAMVAGMRRAMRNEFPDLPFSTAPTEADVLFDGGKPEQSYFWRDERYGIWLKCRPDYTKPGAVIDYKTTDTAQAFGLDSVGDKMGWHIRAAHYLEGHKALTGEDATYWYVVQEKEWPHFTTIAKLDGAWLDWGREILPSLKAKFAAGLRSGRWPSHAAAVVLTPPVWAERRMEERHAAGDYDPSQFFELVRRMQAPLDHGV